ncbi:hypothetical protein R6Z07F_002606 [Ovis aries]
MAFVLSLLMALVLVSYGPGGSLGCYLSRRLMLDARENLRLLDRMNRLSPHSCQQDRKDFGLPQEMVEGDQLQKDQAFPVLYEMLQQSFNLFYTEHSSAAWDTTLLEQLCTGLQQQLDHLDTCRGQVMGEKDSELGNMDPIVTVKKYFQGIYDYLQEKGYSDCAWEIVRVEMMRALTMAEGDQLQEVQAISVLHEMLHEMLQQSFHLFHTECSFAALDTTLLEQLRIGLHEQMEDFHACLGQVMGEEASALGRMGPTLALKRYFHGIHVYLKEKEYSDCAWEIVTVEMMRALSSSSSLYKRFRKMDGDLNSP